MQRHTLKTRLTITMLALSLLGLWSLSYFSIQVLQQDMEHMLGLQQLSAVKVVATSLDAAINEQGSSLSHLARSIEPAMLAQPDRLRQQLERLDKGDMFDGGLQIHDLQGNMLVSAAASAGGSAPPTLRLPAFLNQTRVVVHASSRLTGLLPMSVPLLNDDGQRYATLTGFTNLRNSNFLSRLLAAGYGGSGGYMVVEPEQRLVIAATNPAYVLGNVPPVGHSKLVDRFVGGYEGSGVTRNSSGTEVLASAHRSVLAGWYVAAALPTSDAFAPVASMQRHLLLATVAFALMLGALTWWTLRRQLAPLMDAISTLTQMRVSAAPLQALSVQRDDEIGRLFIAFNGLLSAINQREIALQQSERKLADILDHADSYVYLKDREGRYLYANRRVRTLFQRSMAQLSGLRDEEFFSSASVAMLRQHEQAVWQHGAALRVEEPTVDRRNGRAAIYQSVKLPLRDQAGEIYAMCGISIDITERKQTEEALRIAAIAFEAQAGIAVLDIELRILRVNQAFADITGWPQNQACGQPINILRSARQPQGYYEAMWRTTRKEGVCRDDVWLRRRDGKDFYARGTTSAVYSLRGEVTHYVCHLIDVTESHQRETLRLQQEAAHRDVLVREVHHRIKNNLQGITGILRQFTYKHPELEEPISHAISQVKGMSVVHGLRGRAADGAVHLCELCSEIAAEVGALWQTTIRVDIPARWQPAGVAEDEAVPVALILNELILNAAKHGGRSHGGVDLTIRRGDEAEQVVITISNQGQLPEQPASDPDPYSGMHLVRALMPRDGASLSQCQQQQLVVTTLRLEPPVLHTTTTESS
ncbi:PAS domain S-box protein [Pseudoduganella danionis]|uniref:PAS domain S-box protein n=1 Tax=Pseudoduganella danionis TaxID=1890295 RepID=UPI0035B4E62E